MPTQSKKRINDLIHFWRQFCLNWPLLTEELQRLSNAPAWNDTVTDEGVSPLTVFEGEYPLLFECLYAVFGVMMSNSRLCEQIHGMMRHSLKSEIGMDQADHQRQYASQTDHGMREARQLVGDGYGKSRDEQKKARKHQKTKPQQEMLCHQLIDGSAEYAERVS